MKNEFEYPDGSRGPARAFSHYGGTLTETFLAKRDGENDEAWLARLQKVGIAKIYRIHSFDGDINTMTPGNPVEAEDGGFVDVTHPNPTAKIPCWHTSTREILYVSAEDEIPPGYTDMKPPHEIYSHWNDAGWDIALDKAYAIKQAEIVSCSDSALAPHAVKYGTFEQVSWAKQLKEAEAYLASPDTAVTPWLNATTNTDEDKAALAQEIMDNDTTWSTISGGIASQRRGFQDDLDTAKAKNSPTEALNAILGIKVVYALP